MTLQVPFGSRAVGQGQPVCIVFEAGATHNGLESALALVDVAADAGADAVKFQMIDAKRLVPDASVMFTYDALLDKKTGAHESVTESLQLIITRRELTQEEWLTVIAHCHKRGIDFFSTATTEKEMDFLAAAGAASVKIASGDINYHHFIRSAAKYPWTVQIDTGNATIGEVEKAVDVLEAAGCAHIIINHCPSGYPARVDSINLRILTTLQQMFPYPVAFSDHTPGAVMDIAAVALGAHMIEKTITLDRSIRSPEHIMSLEPDEANAFVDTIRDVERALGRPRKTMSEEEYKRSSVARRSVVAARDLEPGAILTQEDICYVRPGEGIRADMDILLLSKQLRRRRVKGERFLLSDVN